MKIDDLLIDIDKDISSQEREISRLKIKKLKFQKIKDQFPEAHYTNGALCLPNIWDKITCMRIEQKGRYYSTSKINVKFLLGKKRLIDGIKIYTLPFETPVAEIRYTNTSYTARKREILILDYKKIIPLDCPRRNSFIKRIKLHLVDLIMKDGLTVANNSFDKEEITKLMLLR